MDLSVNCLPSPIFAVLTKQSSLNRESNKIEDHSLFGPVNRANRETGATPVRSRRCNPALFASSEKGTFTAMCATVANNHRNGKAVVKAGKPEDLPESV
jgi:hypothetical protein